VLPGGRVVGLDISPSMLEVARGRAAADGLDHVEYVVGDAQSDDLGAGAFDAVFSQFGVMFFADPPAAFTNLRRSLREGGRLAFACWQEVFSNEWMVVPGSAVVTVTGELPPMPPPGEPGPFSLSDASGLEQLLTGAGFAEVEVAPRTAQVVVAADQLDLVVESASKIGAVRAALESIDDPAVADRIRAAVRDALAERVQDGELRLGSAAFVVSAVNPG
jgi:ubiquinone/menaquinone biosynthesis C-methylase UbiE